ncbi:MAG: ATP-binding protein, partial [Nitrospirae bacterium]
MADRESLRQSLEMARAVLNVLEQQAAGYTVLTIPAPLKIQLDEKRNEVASLEARLAQLEGRPPARLPDNLPRRPPIFVGRKEEIARCLTALSPEERGWGVVIDGIGGIGKTALALEVAHIARERAWFDAYLFVSAKTTHLTPDGIREETLALTSLDAFTRRFARLLGEAEVERMSDAVERSRALLDALRGRRALLIWDNLETLPPEERDRIAEFLRKLPAPNKAVVTSRRRTGESALTVRLDRLSEEEAFQLMDEVGRRQPRVAEELARAGDETRRALYDAAGGNPLALHWTLGLVAHKGYSLEKALVRLRDAARSGDLYRFLFAAAARDLGENDRAVLSALAAFQAPASPEALADVLQKAHTEVQSGLERLVALSLVNDLAGGRYGLHPLTRTYVRAALRAEVEEVPLAPAAHRKALRFWVDYAQKYGGDDKDAYRTFDKLEEKWPNLEAAAAALREASGLPGPLRDEEAARMLVDLARALRIFLWFRGYWDEGVRLATWAYEAAAARQAWRDAGWRAYDVAWIHYQRAETERAAAWAARCAEVWERGGSRRDRAVA